MIEVTVATKSQNLIIILTLQDENKYSVKSHFNPATHMHTHTHKRRKTKSHIILKLPKLSNEKTIGGNVFQNS